MTAAGWGKLQYESWDNEKVEAVGNRAWGAFLRAVAWSGYKRKDGWVSAAAMRKIEPDTRVWDRLRAGGMLESREDGAVSLHGWSEHNETTVRRAEREDSYSRRGKAGAASRWSDGNSHASTEASPLKTDERSRSRSRSEKKDQDPETRVPRDPLGLAPLGEDPDAYPGSVQTPLALTLTPPELDPPDPARRVFDAYLAGWRTAIGRGVEPTLTDARRDLVRKRLKEHSADALIAAVSGIWKSAWHVENKHAAFEFAIRNADHIEKFAAFMVPVGPPPPRRMTQAELEIEIAAGRYPRTPPPPELTHAEKIAASDARIAALDAEARARGEEPKPFVPLTLEQIHTFAEEDDE